MSSRPFLPATAFALMLGLPALVGLGHLSRVEGAGPGPLPDLLQHEIVIQPPAEGPQQYASQVWASLAVAADGTVYAADRLANRIIHFDRDGVPMALWGHFGEADGLLKRPQGIAIAPAGAPGAGELVVADTGNRRLQWFSPEGRLLRVWRSLADGSPLHAGIADVAVDAAGRVYLLELPLGRVSILDTERRRLGERVLPQLPTGYQNGGDGALALTPDGDLLVLMGYPNDAVHRYGPDGAYLGHFRITVPDIANYPQPVGLALAPGEVLYIADAYYNRLHRFLLDGTKLGTTFLDTDGYPADVVLAGDRVTVLTAAGFKDVDEAGETRRQYGRSSPTRMGVVQDLAAAPNGDVVAADVGGGRLLRLGPDGRLRQRLGAEGRDEEIRAQLAVTADDRLLAARSFPTQVDQYGPDGAYLGPLITHTEQVPLTYPAGIGVAADGTILVSISQGSAVQRYSAAGRPLERWPVHQAPDALGLRPIGPLATTPDGTLWLLDHVPTQVGTTGQHSLRHYDLSGTLLDRRGGLGTGPGRFNGPLDVAAAPDGTLFVADSGNRRIQRLGPDGAFLGSWSTDTGDRSTLYAVAVDREGRVWVSDRGNARLRVYGPRLAPDWRLALHDNPWLADWPAAITATEQVDLRWGEGPPAPGLPADDWSARLSRTVWQPGTWRVVARATGGLRLWAGEALLVDDWNADRVDTTREVDLPARPLQIVAEFADRGGEAALTVDFEPVTVPRLTPTLPAVYPSPTARPSPWPTPTTRQPTRWIHLPWVAGGQGAAPPTPGAGSPPATEAPPAVPWAGSRAIDVRHYEVRLVAPDPGVLDVAAEATLELAAQLPLSEVYLAIEPRAITVQRVTEAGSLRASRVVPGRPGHAQLSGDRLAISLGRSVAPGEVVKLTLTYTIAAAAGGLGQGFTYDDWVWGNRVYATTDWPYFTRFWLPANDDPADPATLDVTVHVRPGMVAAANGRLVSGDYLTGDGPDAQGLRVFHWSTDQPMPTYGFNVVIGQFDVRVDEVCFRVDTVNDERVPCEQASHRVPMVYYFPAGADLSTVPPATLEKAARAMIYFSSTLGPYPYEKLGFVTAPHPFNMEYPSLITLVSTDAAVHEVAHHWWGDPVTIGHWGDFWISEGLATYFDGLYDEVTTGTNTACTLRTGTLSHPPDTDPLAIFDDVPYCKGAMAIRDLRARLAAQAGWTLADERSRALFLDAMRGLWRAHLGRPLDTPGLLAYLSETLPATFARQGVTVDAADAGRLLATWQGVWFLRPDGADADLAARWAGGEARLPGIEENDWLPRLGALGPVTGRLAWYGLACGDGPPVQDVREAVALVERGSCSFLEKVGNAAGRGARAVVVINDARDMTAMGCTAPCANPPKIPAMLVPREPGLALRDRLTAGTAITATLSRFAAEP